MPRPQFTLRALLILLLAVACFFGGIRFEREQKRRADEAAKSFARYHRSHLRESTEPGLFFSTVGEVMDSLTR